MSTSQVESTRLLHQEIEQHQKQMVQDLLRDGKTVKDRVLNDSRASRRIGAILESAQKLLEAYDDPDGLRKQELEEISGDNVIALFYERLKQLHDYHRRFPGSVVKADPNWDIKLKVKFSSEEAHGKYLDLHQNFGQFLNIPLWERCEYLQYLQSFDKFDHVAKEDKLRGDRSVKYRKYLEDLHGYLKQFFSRVNPLVNSEKLEKMMEEDFKARWDNQAIPSWFGPSKAKPQQQAPSRKRKRGGAAADSKGDAEPERSSGPSENDPSLYCKACQRSFAKEAVYASHIKGKKHKKTVERLKLKMPTNTIQIKKELLSRLLAQLEDKIQRYAELLKEELQETIKRAERKLTLTLDEIQADLEEQSDNDDDSESENEEEKPIYNPLNLPLGWDGKPIPYWLYKLHGLNIEYKCEICGDFSYWGPRAFERHFKEWRHAYGMRCLGIPNTKQFMNITKFKDARLLHEKLKREYSSSGWKPEEEEEFEDTEGNVFNKKTYDDLRRQGLV